MVENITFRARAFSRRKVLALSAAGAAAAALAACGGTTTPTDTPAPTKAAVAPTTGPAATPTAVPQALGGTTAPATAAPAASAAAAPTTAAASSAAGGATPSAAASTANLADKQVFRYADPIPPDGLDPGIITSPYATSQIFEGLITINQKDGTFDAAMAQSYSSNSDATVWTFKMRPGVKWSDGTPITAKDFEYSWQRVMDPKTKSKYTSAFYGIKNGKEVETGKVPPDQLGVKAVDDATFQVTLNEPTPFFPLIASTWTCYPVPKHMIDKLADKWLLGPNVVGNGPWVLKEWKQDQSMSFDQNPTYWGPKPTLTHVDLTLYEDILAKSLAAYENNELDTAQVSTVDYDRVRNDPKLSKEMKGFPGSSSYFLVMDCTNKPTDDVRVRQALALGFDRDPLIKTVLKNYYTDAPTMLPPDIPGYNPAAALTGGVAKAKELMAAAGFPNGQGFPADFTVEYSTSVAAVQKPMLEYLQAEWKKNLGITVQIQAYDSKAYSARRVDFINGQKFNAAMSNWGSDYGDPSNWHNQLFASNANFYGAHWKHPEFDALVAKAKGMTDKDARVKAYMDAEVIFVRESSHVAIYHGQSFYVIKPNVQGVVHRPILGSVPWFKYISITK